LLFGVIEGILTLYFYSLFVGTKLIKKVDICKFLRLYFGQGKQSV
jgi:hypothetical protein